MDLRKYIADYPDFPKPGIIFRDITPLLENPDAFREAIYEMCLAISSITGGVDTIVAPESRGFIFGVPVACNLGIPFLPVRKAGKLPCKTAKQEYSLEYGQAVLEIPEGSIKPGSKVVIIDDLLATGGTFKAVSELIEKMGGEVAKIVTLIELVDLKGRDSLNGYDICSILQLEGG